MNLTPENELAIADLRFLLPLHEGDQVLLFDSCQFLENELAKIEVSSSYLKDLLQRSETSHAEAKINFAILPFLEGYQLDETIKTIFPYLINGAYVIWGTKNPEYWLRYIKPDQNKEKTNITFIEAITLFKEHGFTISRQFGNPDTLNNPRYLIELTSKKPTLHFIESVHVPYTWKGAISRFISKYWIKLFPYSSLYPSIIWLTQFNHSVGEQYDR